MAVAAAPPARLQLHHASPQACLQSMQGVLGFGFEVRINSCTRRTTLAGLALELVPCCDTALAVSLWEHLAVAPAYLHQSLLDDGVPPNARSRNGDQPRCIFKSPMEGLFVALAVVMVPNSRGRMTQNLHDVALISTATAIAAGRPRVCL